MQKGSYRNAQRSNSPDLQATQISTDEWIKSGRAFCSQGKDECSPRAASPKDCYRRGVGGEAMHASGLVMQMRRLGKAQRQKTEQSRAGGRHEAQRKGTAFLILAEVNRKWSVWELFMLMVGHLCRPL